eukprot:7438449-Alexandrium_andersonii.AAC.1
MRPREAVEASGATPQTSRGKAQVDSRDRLESRDWRRRRRCDVGRVPGTVGRHPHTQRLLAD